jgi:hypothetical protein
MRLEVQHQVVKELLDVIDELNDTAPHRNQEEIASGEMLLDHLSALLHRRDEELQKKLVHLKRQSEEEMEAIIKMEEQNRQE